MKNSIHKAYLLGALHDGTYSRLHRTFRFCQKEIKWLERLQHMLTQGGYKSWIYKEGKTRNLFVLETTCASLTKAFLLPTLKTGNEQKAFIRGYFDAEGGIPSSTSKYFYLSFHQKNYLELESIRNCLKGWGITCGKIHNPSFRVDPAYYRFYIATPSLGDYISCVGSWHPRKEAILRSYLEIKNSRGR